MLLGKFVGIGPLSDLHGLAGFGGAFSFPLVDLGLDFPLGVDRLAGATLARCHGALLCLVLAGRTPRPEQGFPLTGKSINGAGSMQPS